MTRLTKPEKQRVPPHDITVEQAFLASVFHSNKIIKDIPDITTDDFYNGRHKIIFSAMLELHEDGVEIGLVTLEDNFKRNGIKDYKNLVLYYTDIVNQNSTSAGAPNYANILKDFSLKRHVIFECSDIIDHAYEINTEAANLKTRVYHFAHSVDSVHTSRGKLSVQVIDWVKQQEGHFYLTEIYKDVGIFDKIDKTNVSQVLSRMVKDGKIERYGTKSGCFRKVDDEAEVIDWKSDDGRPLDIRYPLGTEQFIHTMSKNIILLAGGPNAGKTALLLNFVLMNMGKHKIWYFSSEMGAMELKSRLVQFEDVPIEDWNFEARERADNFSDVIRPNDVNVIDFLEMGDNFYQVGQKLTDIYKRLDKGIAVVALQKDPKAEVGRGGMFSMEKPRLYMTVDTHYPIGAKLKIVKAKNWKDSQINPNGYYREFKIVKGCRLIPGDWKSEH